MIKKVRHVDAILILLQSAVHDARTLNIARSIRDDGGKVVVLAYGSGEDVRRLAQEDIELLTIPGNRDARLWQRWPIFLATVLFKLRAISSKTIWAEDVFSLMPAALLAKKHGARLLYDSRELYFALGTLTASDYRQQFIQTIEERYYRRCDDVIVSGPLDADELHKRYGGKRANVLLNLPPLTMFVRDDKKIHATFALKPEIKVLLYQGGVFKAKGLALATRALAHLPDCVLCIIGDGPYAAEVQDIAEQLGVQDRVKFTGRLPYDELLIWTAAADVGLSLIEATTLSYQLALPNKMFEYCMAGVPTLATDLPAMRAMIDEHGIGKLVAQDATAQEVASAVKTMLDVNTYGVLREACKVAGKVLNWQAQESVVLALQKKTQPRD